MTFHVVIDVALKIGPHAQDLQNTNGLKHREAVTNHEIKVSIRKSSCRLPSMMDQENYSFSFFSFFSVFFFVSVLKGRIYV